MTRSIQTPQEYQREVEKRFLDNVGPTSGAGPLELDIALDNGLYRHLRFRRNPGRGIYWFDIVTSPNLLTIHGDMQTWTFSRAEDMFSFFRDNPDRDHYRISPDYWEGKLVAVPRDGGATEFDGAILLHHARAHLRDYVSWEQPADWPGLYRHFIEEMRWMRSGDEREYVDALMDFSYGTHQPFAEAYDLPRTRYAYHYLWCCYAIVWAIEQYDKAKA